MSTLIRSLILLLLVGSKLAYTADVEIKQGEIKYLKFSGETFRIVPDTDTGLGEYDRPYIGYPEPPLEYEEPVVKLGCYEGVLSLYTYAACNRAFVGMGDPTDDDMPLVMIDVYNGYATLYWKKDYTRVEDPLIEFWNFEGFNYMSVSLGPMAKSNPFKIIAMDVEEVDRATMEEIKEKLFKTDKSFWLSPRTEIYQKHTASSGIGLAIIAAFVLWFSTFV